MATLPKLMTEGAGQVLALKIKANQSSVTTIKAAIDTLNGTGEGSVTKSVNDAVSNLVNNAPEKLDTLKEIADWISDENSDTTSLISQVRENQSNITTIQQAIEDLEAGGLTLDQVDDHLKEQVIKLNNKISEMDISGGDTTGNHTFEDGEMSQDLSGKYVEVTDAAGTQYKGLIETRTGTDPNYTYNVVYAEGEENTLLTIGQVTTGTSTVISVDTTSGLGDPITNVTFYDSGSNVTRVTTMVDFPEQQYFDVVTAAEAEAWFADESQTTP